MTDAYSWLKVLHVLSATVLFGTGLGTAFQMWMAHLSGDPRSIATVSRSVVMADFLFTTPAVIAQPASGIALMWLAGIDPLSSWLVAAYALYALAGACWLPVVWLQIRVRNLAREAVATGASLPTEYGRCMKLWFGLGWPAFTAVIAIFWLMVNKPDLW
jgi:uncharacterized membrane protein